MPIKKIGSPHPRYLAATDILISDMSNISYDFLIYNRPIILIANKWVMENFPDIGIKTDLDGLEDAIKDSIDYPARFEEQRKYWHKITMYKPDGNSSRRVLDMIIEKSGYKKPYILLIHGDNEVAKVHLDPICAVIRERGIPNEVCGMFDSKRHSGIEGLICISTHNEILNSIDSGFKVHIDHSVKGKGVTDFERLGKIYQERDYYRGVDLQVTEGELSFKNTKKLMGPYNNRVVMAGYPKSDVLLEHNTPGNREAICRELRFDSNKPVITYAPTGKYRYPFKQGASLSSETITKIKDISSRHDYNILIKLRSRESASKKFEKLFKKYLRLK